MNRPLRVNAPSNVAMDVSSCAVLIFILAIPTLLSAQWSTVADSVIEYNYRPRALKIAPDGSTWMVVGYDNEMPTVQSPIGYDQHVGNFTPLSGNRKIPARRSLC